MRRDFVGEGEPATGQCPERVFPGCDGRVEWTRSQSRTAGDERAIGEGLQGLSQHRWRIDEDLFERAHRGGAGFDRALSCDFELPHHLDGAVGRLGRRGGLPREHRAGGRLRVDRALST